MTENMTIVGRDGRRQTYKIEKEKIASGSEGEIYRGIDENGKQVAIKFFSNGISIEKGFDAVKEDSEKQKEIIEGTEKTLKVQYSGESYKDSNKFFCEVYNYMDFNLLYAFDIVTLKKPERMVIVLRIILGVCSLHKAGIVHRDLKLENIMLNKDGTIKLIDFGFSEKIKDGKMDYEPKGTPEYAAPELFYKEKLTGEMLLTADIYALGILMYLFIYRDVDFFKNREYRVSILEEKIKKTDNAEEKEFIRLIAKMINPNYTERPKIEETLKKTVEFYLMSDDKSESVKLKPREKIRIRAITEIGDIFVNEEEIKIMEDKTLDKIKGIVEDKNATDSIKQCIKNSINIILNDNIFMVENEKLKELSKEEALKLKKIKNRLREVKLAQNEYCLEEIRERQIIRSTEFKENLKTTIDSLEEQNKDVGMEI